MMDGFHTQIVIQVWMDATDKQIENLTELIGMLKDITESQSEQIKLLNMKINRVQGKSTL